MPARLRRTWRRNHPQLHCRERDVTDITWPFGLEVKDSIDPTD
jgi:hypothetical protein